MTFSAKFVTNRTYALRYRFPIAAFGGVAPPTAMPIYILVSTLFAQIHLSRQIKDLID